MAKIKTYRPTLNTQEKKALEGPGESDSQRCLFKVIQVWQTWTKVTSEASGARFGAHLVGIRVSLGTSQSAGVPAGLQGPRGPVHSRTALGLHGAEATGLHETPAAFGGGQGVVEICRGLVGGRGGGEMKQLPQRLQRLRQKQGFTSPMKTTVHRMV